MLSMYASELIYDKNSSVSLGGKKCKILFYLLALANYNFIVRGGGEKTLAAGFTEVLKEPDYPAASLHRLCAWHARNGLFFMFFRTQTSDLKLSKDFCRVLIKYLMRFQRNGTAW